MLQVASWLPADVAVSLVSPSTTQRTILPGVGTAPVAPSTGSIGGFPTLKWSAVLISPSTTKPYIVLNYGTDTYTATNLSGQQVTFQPVTSTATAPSFVGYIVPFVAANTALGIPFTADVLQLLPAGATPSRLIIQNTSPYTVAISASTTTAPPANIPANGGTYTTATLTVGALYNLSTSTTAIATLNLTGSTNVAPSLTINYTKSQSPQPELFGVTIGANGATGVFTATVYYLGPATQIMNYFAAVNATNQTVVLSLASGSSTTATLQNLNVIDSALGVANTITLPPASTTPVCVTSGSVQLAVVIGAIDGGNPTKIPAMPASTTTASPATGIGIGIGAVSTAIPAVSVNWWGTTLINSNTVSALRPTVNQATSQFALLITSTPLITVAATGQSFSAPTNIPTAFTGTPIIGKSSQLPGFAPELLVPLDQTFLSGGGQDSVPPGVSSAANGPQVLPQQATVGAQQPQAMAILNVDGGLALKVPTTGSVSVVGDSGLASRWSPGSTQGAITFFVPAFVRSETAPASYYSFIDSTQNNNLYAAAANTMFFVSTARTDSNYTPLPAWVFANTSFRVDVAVPLTVDPSVFPNSAPQFLANVCGGNGFTRCRDIAGRPQEMCVGFFDTTPPSSIGALCSAIVLDTAGQGSTNYLDTYNAITTNYCGDSKAVGFGMDACACITTAKDPYTGKPTDTLSSTTKWTFPGEQGSTSFPDYVASFEQKTGTQFPQLIINNAACWWPPCTGATPALLPLNVKTNCTQSVTNCFAAVNQITTDKTSTVSVDIIQACPSANTNDPGGGGNDPDGGSAGSADPVSDTKKSSKAVYISVGVVGAVVVAAIIAGFVVAIRRQNKRAAGAT